MPSTLFERGSYREATRIADVLRKETVGGVLLMIGALIALVWSNTPWADTYESLHLDTTMVFTDFSEAQAPFPRGLRPRSGGQAFRAGVARGGGPCGDER